MGIIESGFRWPVSSRLTPRASRPEEQELSAQQDFDADLIAPRPDDGRATYGDCSRCQLTSSASAMRSIAPTIMPYAHQFATRSRPPRPGADRSSAGHGRYRTIFSPLIGWRCISHRATLASHDTAATTLYADERLLIFRRGVLPE